MSKITEQYMHYVELMDAMQFELAAEYLLMAAVLSGISLRYFYLQRQLRLQEKLELQTRLDGWRAALEADRDRLETLDRQYREAETAIEAAKAAKAPGPKKEEHYSLAQHACRMVVELVAGLGIGFGIGIGLGCRSGLQPRIEQPPRHRSHPIEKSERFIRL